MTRSGPVLAVAVAIAVGGCASLRQSVSGWFGETPEAAASPTPAQQAQRYYAGVADLPVFAEPSAGSKVVGHLPLYEKITRTRLDRGYAYVTVERGGLEGWVDNAQLIWRRPAPGAGAPPEEERGKPASQAPPAAEEAEPTATATSIPIAPVANPTPRARQEPSVFDPF